MTFVDFKRALRQAAPPAAMPPSLQGLWWAGKGDWDRAHKLVQDEDGTEAA